MVIDNQRVLLGRNAFDPNSGNRHFRAATLDDDEFAAAIKPMNVFAAVNHGDIPVAPPYELQVWKLAGKDPASRLARQDRAATRPVAIPIDENAPSGGAGLGQEIVWRRQ